MAVRKVRTLRVIWFFIVIIVIVSPILYIKLNNEEFKLIDVDGKIHVFDNGNGIRRIKFSIDGFRQSEVKIGDIEYLPMEYTRAMIASLTFLTKVPESILIVGLGGATIPSYLKSHFPNAKIEIIELIPSMLNIAERYSNFKKDENCTVLISDGREYLEKYYDEKKFDLIIQDGCATAPCSLLTLDSFKKLSGMLKPKGIHIQNLIGMDPPIVKNIKDSYDEFYYVESKAINQIVVAYNGNKIYTKEDLILRGERYQESEKPKFNLVEDYSKNFKRLTDIMINSLNYE